MRATIDLLYRLQLLDDEIDALRRDEGAIPEKRRAIDAALESHAGRVQELKQESINLAKQRKAKEIELEAAAQKKAKFQSQTFQVKSNKEYEALKHEIGALDGQISGFEDEILGILDRTDEVSGAIVREEEALALGTEKSKREHADLDKALAEIGQAVAVRVDDRAGLVEGLDPALLQRYEVIRKSKGGLAVAVVKNGACGGCFRRIPPQEMQILKRSDRVVGCEGCGRIILWRGDEV